MSEEGLLESPESSDEQVIGQKRKSHSSQDEAKLTPVKRGRGRPKANIKKIPDEVIPTGKSDDSTNENSEPKKGRGRPKGTFGNKRKRRMEAGEPEVVRTVVPGRGRGRPPKKNQEPPAAPSIPDSPSKGKPKSRELPATTSSPTKGRGRPQKIQEPSSPRKGRGRPQKKVQEPESEEDGSAVEESQPAKRNVNKKRVARAPPAGKGSSKYKEVSSEEENEETKEKGSGSEAEPESDQEQDS